jgi:hypothetical protein
MKKAIIVIILLSALPAIARAGDWFAPLSKTDMALMAVDTALLATDWGQTRYIATHPGEYHELNPLLGPHPSVGTVDAHIAAAIPLYWLTAWALPPKEDHGYKRFINREYLSIAVAVYEGANIGNNARVGIGIKF